MTLIITGSNLTTDDVVAVARHGRKLELSPDALGRIARCRSFIQERIEAHEIMYGVNTGIGEFSEVVLDDDKMKDFQRFLIYNHAAGIGEPFPEEIVRAAMTTRVNVHSRGYSAIRPAITQLIVDMLNRRVTPVVCTKGSVGACGDLAPMSQIALCMLGEGEAYFEGTRMPARDALSKAGLAPVVFEARDGLGIINGSNVIAGMGCLAVYDAERFLLQSEIACAMTLEALVANMKPYDQRLHALRGFGGAVTSARNLYQIMDGSDLRTGKHKTRVQDAYSMRSSPQVIGTARDQLRWTKSQIEVEINGVGDNPLFLADEKVVLTGANFQGSPISLPIDTLGGAVNMVCVLSERRLNRLTNPALSAGLPAFLTRGAGMFSGMMLSQYTACMQVVEQKILCTPAYNQSIPAAADQEDFVSMGMNSALKTRHILEVANGVICIEMMAAAQGLDFRKFTPGKGTQAAKAVVREVVDFLDEDRPLFRDHNAILACVAGLKPLQVVEAAVGELHRY